MKPTRMPLQALAIVFAMAVSLAEAAKPPAGGGGSGGPTPKGTIYYTNGITPGFWAMNADGTGKTPVIMATPPGHRLNPDGTGSTYGYGMPSDQVYGSNSKLDRWYLLMVHTNTVDRIIYTNGVVQTSGLYTYPDGTTRPTAPENLYHYDMFAYRSDPADRNTVVAVQITDFFGLGWCKLNGQYAYWSNDNNESPDSFVGSGFEDIRTCFYVDDEGNSVIDYNLDPDQFNAGMSYYQLPLKGSEIQAAWLAGRDLNFRPGAPEDLDLITVAAWPELSRTQNGGNYVVGENDQLVLRSVVDNALVRVIWDGTRGIQPKHPGSAVLSRDGLTVIFKNEGDASFTSKGGYWRVPVTGGTPTQLVPESYKSFKWTSYSRGMWSPDSQFISLTYLLNDQSRSPAKITKDVMRLLPSGGTLTNLTADDSTPTTGYRWVSNTVAP